MPIIFECDGCARICEPNDALLQVSINAKPMLLFCTWDCLSRWAAQRSPTHEITRQNEDVMHQAQAVVDARRDALYAGNARAQAQESVEQAVSVNAPPPTGPISARCELGEHFSQGESAGTGKEGVKGCDGAMPASMTDHGAPDKWIECSCWCHNATRREMIEVWNGNKGKYGLANSGPLVVAA